MAREGQINAWDMPNFVKAIDATGRKTLAIAGTLTRVIPIDTFALLGELQQTWNRPLQVRERLNKLEYMMQALFVHGMGRSPLSGWPILLRLKANGMKVGTFGYLSTFQDFSSIRMRLAAKISKLAEQGDYVLIGHSLGGVLLRAAVASLPKGTRLPRRIFLLGSPVKPARLARKLLNHRFYRTLTGDCGQLLGSESRMAEIGPAPVPTTSIVGIAGLTGKYSPFEGEPNNGVISVSEASAEWIAEVIRIPLMHTFLPWSQRVARIILERVAAREG